MAKETWDHELPETVDIEGGRSIVASAKRVSKPRRGYGLTKRRGVWQINYIHPSETREVQQCLPDGTVETRSMSVRKFVTLKREDGLPVTERREAERIAAEVAQELRKRRLIVQERGPKTELTLSEGERTRWPVVGSLEDFVTSKQHPTTRATAAQTLQRFQVFLREAAVEYLDEITSAHGVGYRQALLENRDLAARTKDSHLGMAKSFLNWCVEMDRLEQNPFTQKRLRGFHKKRSRERRLSKGIPIVHRAERERLLQACSGTQERLMFLLSTLLGLRASEVTHLCWGDFKRHTSPPRLAIIARGDWLPKTGERLVPVIYPEVAALLTTWFRETPHGNGKNDWMFIGNRRGVPFSRYPRQFIRRLQATGVQWTPTIGRHTACSILPLHAERLTGRRWTELEHAQFFGHDFKTSQTYYITEHLIDLASHEGVNGECESASPAQPSALDADEQYSGTGLDVDLARKLLRKLLACTKRSRASVADAAGVNSGSLGQFLKRGQTVPTWFFAAVRTLL